MIRFAKTNFPVSVSPSAPAPQSQQQKSASRYVKKPECPALQSGDEWPSGLEAIQPPSQKGFFTCAMGSHIVSFGLYMGKQGLVKRNGVERQGSITLTD
jgi:hypothetical protein